MKSIFTLFSIAVCSIAQAQGPSYYNAPATLHSAYTNAPAGNTISGSNNAEVITAGFGQSYGMLSAPVDNSYIIQNFGKYKIENGGPDIVGDNPGLTYGTPAGATVKAVYDGEVAHISGMGNTQCIVLKHGRYYTAYGNLAMATVRKGEIVSKGQAIGTVAADEDNNSRGKLDFMLINDGKNVNPRFWLKP